jgi:hypothetical protein
MQKKHFLMPEGFASLDEKFDFDIYVWTNNFLFSEEKSCKSFKTQNPLGYQQWIIPPHTMQVVCSTKIHASVIKVLILALLANAS